MSNASDKSMSIYSQENVLRDAHNRTDNSILVNGFLAPVVGRQISQVITTTTVSGDTAVLTFSENGTQLYVYTIIYTDATQSVMLSATRTA